MTEVQDTFDIGRNRRQAKQHHATSSTTTSGAFSPTAGGSSSSTAAAAAGRADGNSPISNDTSPSQSSSHSPPPAAAVPASSTSNGLVAPHPNHVVSAGGLGSGAPTRGFRVPAQRRMQQQQGGDSSEDDEGHAGNGNGLVSDVSEVYQFGGDEAFDAIIEQPNPKNVAWRCGSCGYCMLAIDHRGAPLPLTRDAFGRVIPMQCPKCMLRHAQWTPCEPFRNNGDHVNVKSTFSNTVRAAYEAPLVRQSSALGLTTATAATTVVPVTGSVGTAASSIGANSSATSTATALPAILASIGAVTYREGVAVPTAAAAPAPRAVRQTYICGLCQRKLLRIDQFGALVPLDLDTAGNVAPLRCPGCKQIHSDWPIKSM